MKLTKHKFRGGAVWAVLNWFTQILWMLKNCDKMLYIQIIFLLVQMWMFCIPID